MFSVERDRVIGNLCFNNILILAINNKQICPKQITEMPNLSQLVWKQLAAFVRQPYNRQTGIFTCLQKTSFEKTILKKMKVQNSYFSFFHIVFSSIPTRKLHFIGLTLKNCVLTYPTDSQKLLFFFCFLTQEFFLWQNASCSYFPLVVKLFTDIPISCGLFKEKTENSTNFTVPVFLQYFYFYLLFKCIRKSGFPKKFCQKSIVFYFTERFPKAKVVNFFLFNTNGGATCRSYYQWSIEITNIC